MKQNKLTIEIPEGHEIDWQESAKQEKIVFKKTENTKPRSWEEYLELNLHTGFDGSGIDWNMNGGVQATGLHHRGKAIVPTKLASPFIAMMQLMSVREDWIKDWVPDYNNDHEYKWYITFSKNKLEVFYAFTDSHSLSFPTKEIAEDFIKCFKDLLDIAKPLI